MLQNYIERRHSIPAEIQWENFLFGAFFQWKFRALRGRERSVDRLPTLRLIYTSVVSGPSWRLEHDLGSYLILSQTLSVTLPSQTHSSFTQWAQSSFPIAPPSLGTRFLDTTNYKIFPLFLSFLLTHSQLQLGVLTAGRCKAVTLHPKKCMSYIFDDRKNANCSLVEVLPSSTPSFSLIRLLKQDWR